MRYYKYIGATKVESLSQKVRTGKSGKSLPDSRNLKKWKILAI
jgi:hypothetical protein